MKATPMTLAEASRAIPDTVTPDQLRALTRAAGGKYHSRRTFVPEIGRWFDSQREADAAVALWRRQQAGEVRNLRFQPRYRLEVNGVHVCDYVADFAYEEHIGADYWPERVADAKGFPTPMYRVKKRLMWACWVVDVIEL